MTTRKAITFALYAFILGACGTPDEPGLASCNDFNEKCQSDGGSSGQDTLAEASDNNADIFVPKTDTDAGVETTTSTDGVDSAKNEVDETSDAGTDADSADSADGDAINAGDDGGDTAEENNTPDIDSADEVNTDNDSATDDSDTETNVSDTDVAAEAEVSMDGDETESNSVDMDADTSDATDDGTAEDADQKDTTESESDSTDEDGSETETDTDIGPELPACVTGIGQCEDKDPCTTDWCDYTLGCMHKPNSTEKCTDGNVCTTKDTCKNGACVGGVAPNCDDGNLCTDDSCNPATECVNLPNTVSCTDGNACTTKDTCKNGVCVGGVAPVCNDSNLCTDDSCNPAMGCVNLSNTVSCTDGDACTKGDQCNAGVCKGGVAPNCNDANPCTTDSCDKALGCVNTPNADACDDGNACTKGDACKSGVCVSGTPIVCNDSNVCTDDGCDVVKGCVFANNSSPCDDGNVLTEGDKCVDGQCLPGVSKECNDANPCTNDVGDPKLGCLHQYNTSPCTDGNACTTKDTCKNGVCVGGVAPVCNDSNLCTDDSCNPAMGCVNLSNTVSCTDGDACTKGDQCNAGVCKGGVAPNCNDANPCTTDSCDKALGCVNTPNADACDDGDACTTGDQCNAGVCKGGVAPNCNDGNPCTTDSCDKATGCVNTPNADACDDGNACTKGDACKSGACVPGASIVCNDSNVCTDDGCEPAKGCVFANNSSPCDDENVLTDGDKCVDGQCLPGVSKECNDGNPCTNDVGDPKLGCLHQYNTSPCTDGNACTTKDTCKNGACVGGVAPNCDDGNLCTDDLCNPATGCVNLPNTISCTDGDACTTGDQCNAGVCKGGVAPNCNDGNSCTTDSCDKVKGCVNTPNADACDDGNACTTSDKCANSICVGGLPPNCNDANPCTDDSCENATGCKHTANTGACDDGNLCTLTDMCAGGVCVGMDPVDCDDANACTKDVCNKLNGVCQHSKQTGTPCNDGNACTTVDTCASGVCTGATPPNCDDANACTADSCDTIKGCQHADTSASCSDGNVCTDDACEPSKGCVFANNTKPCDDKSVCTTVDTCANGVCVGASPKSCDDGNLCTDDSCDPLKDCQHANNTAVCNDSNQCTDPDTCTAGTCKGTPKADGVVCDDGKSCNVDSCQSGVCVGAPFASANFDTDGQPPAGWTAYSAAGVTYNGSQGYTSKPTALFSHNNVSGNGKPMTVTSPTFSLPKGNTAVIYFDMLNIGGTNAKATTVTFTCNNNAVILFSKNGPDSMSWKHFTYTLDSFEGVCVLDFQVNGGMGALGLDSIMIGCP